MVPSKGLEPPHPCGYMDLNHARLPIPPRWQLQLCTVILAGRLAGRKEVQIHSTEAKQRVKPRGIPIQFYRLHRGRDALGTAGEDAGATFRSRRDTASLPASRPS